MNEHLLFERKGNIEWITFNNPAKANNLSRNMLRSLIDHLQTLQSDEKVRAVIFTGSGEKFFSAGMDINEFKGLNSQTGYELISELKQLCELARKIPQAVVMAINGYCIGGAMELAMAADIRVASKNAVFVMPEIKLGIPSVLDSVLLQQHIGLSLAKEMLLTGDVVDAERINRFGFLNALVDLSELRTTAEAFAHKITANDRITVQQQKQLFETWLNSSLEVAIQDSMNQFALSFNTDVPKKKLEEFLSAKQK
jgi:enoyl-CoA hydratase